MKPYFLYPLISWWTQTNAVSWLLWAVPQYTSMYVCLCYVLTLIPSCTYPRVEQLSAFTAGLLACCDVFWYILVSHCFNLSFLKHQRGFLYPLSLINFTNKHWLNDFLLTQQPREYFKYADSKQAEPQQCSPRIYLSFLLCLLLSPSAYPYPDLFTCNCYLALSSICDFVTYPESLAGVSTETTLHTENGGLQVTS